MHDDIQPERRLGSLAQAARSKNLRSARWILIFIGVLNSAFYIFMFSNVENEANQAIEEERKKLGPGMVIDPVLAAEAKQKIIRLGHILYAGYALLGAVFIGLGVAVYRIPVVATILGLVLYIAGGLVAVIVTGSPEALFQGLLIKILIIVGLSKAIQSALAYQREEQAADFA